MHMYYWLGTILKDFLFKGYNVTSVGGLVATCFGLASLAIILEAIKVYRASIYLKKPSNNVKGAIRTTTSETIEETTPRTAERSAQSVQFRRLLVHTTWYTVQDVVGYIVMLAVMTYNGYFTLAVIFGSALGYFVFGPWLMEIRLNAGTLCSKQQKCAVCIGKMERAHLLSAASTHSYDGCSSNETNNSLVEVAEGLASVMQNSNEERVAVEVHSQEHCT